MPTSANHPNIAKMRADDRGKSLALAYERLIERFLAWARIRPDIRAAIVLGSRARTDHPADPWSDLDMVVVVTDPKPFLTSAEWLKNVGPFWVTFVEPTATENVMERRVLFEGGLDADFAIISCAKFEKEIGNAAEFFRRGVRVLLDKDDFTAGLFPLSAATAPSGAPTVSDFLAVVDDFWYHAVWTAKKLRRGELWVAKGCCDGHMKRLLRKAMEWQAKAVHGWDTDTWHEGRFLEEWADHRAQKELRGAFAHYDEGDVRRALLATMHLFRWVAKEMAERLGYPYPALADERTTEFVDALLSGKA
jgi:aminoglycoside 6-adenylyltransferase